MKSSSVSALVASFLWLAVVAGAEPIAPSKVPETLRPWTDWVLHDQEEALCPFLQDGDGRRCLWPSRLVLTLEDRFGRFTQDWLVLRDAWVPLPGDSRRWPIDATVDGKPAAVALRDGVPSVRLEKGKHALSGSFQWDSLPELLTIPPETGLVSLVLRGQTVPFPNREPQGQLWVQKRAEAGEASRLDVVVHRMVSDEIPLLVRTRVELRVAGKSREVRLGRALPEGSVPMSLTTPLPARVEPDGRLRVQVRPGTWTLELVARNSGRVEALSLPRADGPWDDEEVWVFDARPAFRLVNVEAVPPIDPQQTELPPEWRHLPAFRMMPGSSMKLVEKRRGDSDPAPDQLALQRIWWLDFDGRGFTVRDAITGTMSRSWRLEMAPPTELGRVSLDGRDQFITRHAEDGARGVEIRQSRLQVEADSRVDGRASRMPAVGWLQDFQQVSGELRLPPGWRLFYASGVDDVSTSWMTDWTLLDLFVVLVTAMTFARIAGSAWGAVALVGLVITYREPGAPGLLWLLALAGIALVRVIPEGRLLRLARLYTFAAFVVLVIVAIPFAIQQLRNGIWPALERPWAMVTGGVGGGAVTAPATLPREMDELAAVGRLEDRSRDAAMSLRAYAVPESKKLEPPPQPHYRYAIDPNAKVTTGPGVPRWGWSSVALRWRGPVERDQSLSLLLISPRQNLLLAWLQVGFVAALLFALARLLAPSWRSFDDSSKPAVASAGAALLVVAYALLAPRPALADFPSNELLEQLRTRLLENPECFPHCASIPRLRLEAKTDVLRLRLEVDAAAHTAIPLPGGAKSWTPVVALLDGAPAAGLARGADGVLWIELSPGRHQLILEGAVPPVDSVDVPLPLRPGRVDAEAAGWSVAGVREDGLPEDNLQLVRIERDPSRGAETLQPGALPPFVRVERTLRLGLSAEVDTVISRLSPAGSAVLLEVPLLAGESVTTPDVRVENGKALVSMAPQASAVGWHSILENARTIELRAPESVPWVEVWRVDASPIWHVDVTGIPVVHQQAGVGVRAREWRAWPGEKVSLALSRPAGMPGPTLTIDRSQLDVSPGLRATDATLTLDIRSSQGGRHVLTLPEEAELQSVAINGQTQPIRQEARGVTIPVTPGTQTVTLVWREPHGIDARFDTPAVDVGAPSVNADVHVAMPADRWTLFLGGGTLGPVVLFWSVLVVLALVSVALGRLRQTPLRPWHWFLLGIGLTQVDVKVAAIVAGWLLALGWRRERGATVPDDRFNLMQLALVIWTVLALAGLVASIEQGLLGLPEMQISGNGSSAFDLRWYHDRAGTVLPRVWVISVPLLVYRAAMLAWALWLAWAMLSWLRWGWEAFATGGLWRTTAWRLRRRGAAPPKPAPQT